MDIEKKFRVAAPQAKVWEFITSAEQVATCIPGVEEVQVVSPGQYKGMMKIKVGPIRTSVNADVNELEQRAPEFASYMIKGEEGGRASHLTAEARLALTPAGEDTTDVVFNAHVAIVGRLAKFAGGVMNALADTMSEDFVISCRRQLEPEFMEPAKVGLWARIVTFFRSLFGVSKKSDS